MEAKTYSCSECGLKTPSRMTYIQVTARNYFLNLTLCDLQHVLNGCIMDMVMGDAGATQEDSSQPLGGIKRPGVRPLGQPVKKVLKVGHYILAHENLILNEW